MEPRVTGLSPMTGTPGTKITVRGECLGQSSNDIIGLTINGADCLPYLEWQSPKKILARCTKAIGNGDVVITTKSGGVGSCDVQFNCYEEFVGPTDECAVWVDDIDYQLPQEENFNISSTNDEYSIEMASTRFKPHLYLVRNHLDANLGDLRKLQMSLRTKLASRNDSETISSDSNRAALLKSNLPVIMECLQILERLSKVILTSRDTSIDSIVMSIDESLSRTLQLFDPLLKQNNIVQSIEIAMQVFKSNRGDTFFDLPLAIEKSVQNRNYDSIVKEISNITSRLKKISIDSDLKIKIENDVSKKVERLKETINMQLHESCRSTTSARNIDEVKKLITHLNRLEQSSSSQFDVWVALEEMTESLVTALSSEFKNFLSESLKESKELNLNPNVDFEKFCQTEQAPPVVKFIQSSISMFHGTYYDILALGQSYFDPKDEFACREEFRIERLNMFNEKMISNPIKLLCSLLRLMIISNYTEDDSLNRSLFWPGYEEEKDIYTNWLRHVINKHWLRQILHSVITCHFQLSKVSVPVSATTALQDFKRFVIDLRRQSMEILFKNAALANKRLHHKEDWVTEVDDEFGSVTKLPTIFEANVVEVLQFAKDTILRKSQPDEASILNNVAIQAEMKELAYGLINSFHTSLDNALSSGEEHPAEASFALIASSGSTRVPTQLSNRLLITICNYHYTKNKVFVHLKEEFKKILEFNVEKVFEECGKKYRDYMDRTMRRFCAIKCKELTSCSDYLSGGKDGSTNIGPNLQINLMIANSQIFLVAPQLVDELMPEIINKTLQDRGRVRL